MSYANVSFNSFLTKEIPNSEKSRISEVQSLKKLHCQMRKVFKATKNILVLVRFKLLKIILFK